MERVVPESIEQVKELYTKDEVVMVDLKTVPMDLKVETVRYALSQENLSDPLMTMNLINLVKVYNTLDDDYFANEDIYVNSVEELLDLKLAISAELKAFTRQISIYFMSLFKSYNKMEFTVSDLHMELPRLYSSVFCATDLLTLSGIFAKTPEFSTKELVYIDSAYEYISLFITKGMDLLEMMGKAFDKQGEEDDTTV